MAEAIMDANLAETAAEYLRLSLAKLGKLKLAITPVNYALVYFYVSGDDLELNARLDEMFADTSKWSDKQASELFSRYICQCSGEKNHALEQELLLMVAQILGMVVDLAGKTALSSDELDEQVAKLAVSKDPVEIIGIASTIVAETRSFVDETRKFESSLRESTQEIEQLKGKLDTARKQATVDSLTNLNNRRGFDAALAKAIKNCRSSKKDFCLMILDIDHFKRVNDTHGHLVGDKVLIGIAKQLLNHMRGNDYLSRYGGEEFAILLLDTPITGAFTVAENLRRTIGRSRLKHSSTGQKIGKVTTSIGIASYDSNETAENLIDRCDKALYRAKSLGRDRTIIAD